MRIFSPCLAVAALLWAFAATSAVADPASPARFDAEDALMLPDGYREWVFLGATVSPQDLNFGSAYSPGIKHTYMV